MYSIFYVESPLQLLSAISARDNLKVTKPVLFVNISAGERMNNDTQMISLIDENWFNIIIQKKKKGKLKILYRLFYNLIFFIFKYRGKVDKYFFGEYRSIEMALANRLLSPSESILLDDGSFTITAQNHYIKNAILPYPNSNIYKVFGFLVQELATPNLYSFYDFDSSLIDGQVNYYIHPVRKCIECNKKELFFFGSKLSEARNVHLKDELYILSKVPELYLNYKLIYIPHRDENNDKLNSISKLGFEIKSLNKPAEVYFDEVTTMPETVLSYYSTVLYSCYIRFNNIEIKSINIESYLLQDSSKLNAKEIYEYYKTIDIEIITL